MDKTRDRSTPPPFNRRNLGCPYMGVKADPQTRFSTASPGNYCHRVHPAEPVTLDHQDGFCLSDGYLNCVVYSPQWKGGLPAQLRGEGDGSNLLDGPRVLQGAGQLFGGLKDRLSRNPSEPPPVSAPRSASAPEEDEVDMFRRLHQEARSRVARYPDQALAPGYEVPDDEPMPLRRSDRVQPIWIVLLLVGLVVIAFSIWGVLQRIDQINKEAISAESTSLAAISLVTAAEQTALFEAGQTATVAAYTPTPVPATSTPTATTVSAEQATQNAITTAFAQDTQQALALAATQTASVSCENTSGYQVAVISGPVLNPPLGTYYYQGDTPPTPQAVWVLQNSGACDWKKVSLLYTSTGATLVPILRQSGALVDAENLLLRPGEQIELALAFNGANAFTVNTQYTYIINGVSLSNLPPLTLDVTRWILTIAKPTATPKTSSGGGGGGGGGEPGRATPTPPGRP